MLRMQPARDLRLARLRRRLYGRQCRNCAWERRTVGLNIGWVTLAEPLGKVEHICSPVPYRQKPKEEESVCVNIWKVACGD